MKKKSSKSGSASGVRLDLHVWLVIIVLKIGVKKKKNWCINTFLAPLEFRKTIAKKLLKMSEKQYFENISEKNCV